MNKMPDVAIVGAGPYALSLAAQLTARGVEHRIFGHPMETWRTQMPTGMFLKSDGSTTDLFDSERSFTLRRFCEEQNIPYADEGLPVSLDTFCAYGLAFQKRLVPELECTLVTRLTATTDGFELGLDNGETLWPATVVLAVGISHFQFVPNGLASLPRELGSHSSECTDPAHFKGRDVTVIGGGASALDLAGLMQSAGARVRLIVRKPSINFHTGPQAQPRSLFQRLRHPKSGLGPSLRSFIYCEAPLAFHCLPERMRLRIVHKHLGPAGGWFIRDQVLGKVSILLGHTVQHAQPVDGAVHLQLRDASGVVSEVRTDYVIAATGYQVDMQRLSFLDAGLLARLKMTARTPMLSSNFETSEPHLHVIGPAAANSFGPLMRFAYGAGFVAKRLSSHLARQVRRRTHRPVDVEVGIAASRD